MTVYGELDADWEGPVFKVLTQNDSGQRAGHQAGFVVPKQIAGIFPDAELRFTALLLIDGALFGRGRPRFQIQTWGGTRPGERRVTDLGEWDRQTSPGDVVLIERSTRTDLLYRISLITTGTARHAAIVEANAGRWGSLSPDGPVVDYDAIRNAEADLAGSISSDFEPFAARRKASDGSRIARSRAFQRIILTNYRSCAVCGGGLRVDDAITELEAGHIISVSAGGSDDPRNGLALCRAHHWAFDRGLIGVDADAKVLVAGLTVSAGLEALVPLRGRPLIGPARDEYRPHPVALDWHRNKVFGRLDVLL